jgi:hypothetical protein
MVIGSSPTSVTISVFLASVNRLQILVAVSYHHHRRRRRNCYVIL